MIKQLEKIMRDVSKNILLNAEIENTITYKEKDIVTYKDLQAERYIIKEIKKIDPDAHFISEEENHEKLTDAPTWIIDPIDGTLNFSRQIPQFGIQIAYYINQEPELALMYFPLEQQFLHAVKDQGFYVNHKKIVYTDYSLDQSIVTFGDFSRSQPESRKLQIDMISAYMNHVMKTRIYGASSTDFAYVLTDKSQAHIIFTKRIWELAAGLFMAKEAGLSVLKIQQGKITGAVIGRARILESLMSLYTIENRPYFK